MKLQGRRRTNFRRLVIESLEDRVVLSGSTGTLTVAAQLATPSTESSSFQVVGDTASGGEDYYFPQMSAAGGNGYRPPAYGPVQIVLQNAPAGADVGSRPLVVEGLVAVPNTVLRGSSNPGPSSGATWGQNIGAVPGESSVSFDRGHVMALQLGGPDDAYNVVPQLNYWQQNGAWATMETSIVNVSSGLLNDFYNNVVHTAVPTLNGVPQAPAGSNAPVVLFEVTVNYPRSTRKPPTRTPGDTLLPFTFRLMPSPSALQKPEH